jgi:hypothetical protein
MKPVPQVRYAEPVQRAVSPPVVPVVAVGSPRQANPLIEVLRQRDSLRRAVVLKEVLGPPKALQSDEGFVF